MIYLQATVLAKHNLRCPVVPPSPPFPSLLYSLTHSLYPSLLYSSTPSFPSVLPPYLTYSLPHVLPPSLLYYSTPYYDIVLQYVFTMTMSYCCYYTVANNESAIIHSHSLRRHSIIVAIVQLIRYPPSPVITPRPSAQSAAA